MPQSLVEGSAGERNRTGASRSRLSPRRKSLTSGGNLPAASRSICQVSATFGADENESFAVTSKLFSLEIAKETLHLKTCLLQKRFHLLIGVGAHALQECLHPGVGTPHPHALVDALGALVEPALDIDFVALALLMLPWHQVGHHMLAVEQIDQKAASRDQHSMDLLEDPDVLPLVLEIAEGGEEIEHPGERVRRKGQATHVGRNTRLTRWLGQESQREVHTEGPNSTSAQGLGVATGAAGQIEHRPRCIARQDLGDEFDMRFGLTLVPVGIELEILGAKPLFVPRHSEMISTCALYGCQGQ